MASSEGIRVYIYDQEYRMRGEVDPVYIQKLATYLDGKMRSIAEQTRSVDSLRVAILAGLNIADEYYQLKEKFENITHEVGQKVTQCAEALDQVLDKES